MSRTEAVETGGKARKTQTHGQNTQIDIYILDVSDWASSWKYE